MFSIYTAAYNLINMDFDYKSTLRNWAAFLRDGGEIVIAVNTSTDDTFARLNEYVNELRVYFPSVGFNVFQTDIPYDNPWFDGMIKTAALRRCTQPYCCLLDMDEVIPLWTRGTWRQTAFEFARSPAHAMLIPSLDVFHDPFNYKSLGYKWYLHKNLDTIERGPVDFARRGDGTIDITKSDTCEPIYIDSKKLVSTIYSISSNFPEMVRLGFMSSGQTPFVYHLGWLYKEKRLKQSAFWSEVWNRREGREVERAKTTEELDAISYQPHGLRHWEIDR